MWAPPSPRTLTITVSIYGPAGSGKKTLGRVLTSTVHRRRHDRTLFLFNVLPEPCIEACDIALILRDATCQSRLDTSHISSAAQSSKFAAIVLTKIDVLQEKFPSEFALENIKHTLAYHHNVVCVAANLTSAESTNCLLQHIVDVVHPFTGFESWHSMFVSVRYKLFDYVAYIFSLPAPKSWKNVETELDAIANQPDLSSFHRDSKSLQWEDDLRSRLRVQSTSHIPMKRITQSIMLKPMEDSEIAAMQFISCNTTIPIPRLHRIPSYDKPIFMDLIAGDMLYECWDKLSWLMQFRIACTLRLYVKQMRSLRRDTYGAVNDGHIRGILFEEQDYTAKYLPSQVFRRFCELVSFEGWRARVIFQREYRPEVVQRPLPRPRMDWTPVFTHGDLNMTNLLLGKDGCLWVLDWGESGFYPCSMEGNAMRYMNEILHNEDIPTSWKRYRHFIAGHQSESPEEEDFWDTFYSAIHRFQE